MKHLFFLGLGVSAFPSSLLVEARGAGTDAAGWFTTMHGGGKGKAELGTHQMSRQSQIFCPSFLLLRKPLQAPLSADCRAAYF